MCDSSRHPIAYTSHKSSTNFVKRHLKYLYHEIRDIVHLSYVRQSVNVFSRHSKKFLRKHERNRRRPQKVLHDNETRKIRELQALS